MQRNLQTSRKKAKNPRTNQQKKTSHAQNRQRNKEISHLIIAIIAVIFAFYLGFKLCQKINQVAKAQELSQFDQIGKVLVKKQFYENSRLEERWWRPDFFKQINLSY